MKTEYTRSAGRTLVSCTRRNGRTLVVVTLQDGNDWADHEALYDYGFGDGPGLRRRKEDGPWRNGCKN